MKIKSVLFLVVPLYVLVIAIAVFLVLVSSPKQETEVSEISLSGSQEQLIGIAPSSFVNTIDFIEVFRDHRVRRLNSVDRLHFLNILNIFESHAIDLRDDLPDLKKENLSQIEMEIKKVKKKITEVNTSNTILNEIFVDLAEIAIKITKLKSED